MSLLNCSCKCRCAVAAIIVSAIVGVVTAFLQITGTITVTAPFLWVVFGIAIVYLGVLVVASALARRSDCSECKSATLNTVLAGILGTIALALVLLAVGIVATSVVSAILVGLLALSFALTVLASACYVRQLSACS